MTVPKASEDLHKYKAWLESLKPLAPTTIIRWIDPKPYRGSTQADDITLGQMFLLGNTRDAILSFDKTIANQVYMAVQCTKTGKPYKRTFRPYVYVIAQWLEEGKIEILNAA